MQRTLNMKKHHLNRLDQGSTCAATPGIFPAKAARQQGFTLIEISIVIAIGLLMVLAGLKFGPALRLRTEVSAEVQNLGHLAVNVRNTYAGRYVNLSTANVVQLNLAPLDMLNTDNVNVDPNVNFPLVGHWSYITLSPNSLANGIPNSAMQIDLVRIPQDVCTQLAPALLPMADEMQVNGTTVKWYQQPNPPPDLAAMQCGPPANTVSTHLTTITIRMR
jgi:prepilin-type N-terminal cleavage/methylation domain-containing protein